MHLRLFIATLAIWLLHLPMIASAQTAVGACWVYTFEATTTTWGGTVTQQGVLVVFPDPIITSTGTTTPANEWEFWFQISNPYTSPSPGAIYFATNSAITNTTGLAAARLQLADITLSDGYYVVTPGQYESQQMVNMFNAYGGLTATPYTVTSGTMGIAFSEDFSSVSAVVDFLGHSFYTPGQRADVPYQAELNGTFLTDSTDCVTPGR